MLYSSENKSQYILDLHRWSRIQTGKFKYEVKRIIGKKSDKKHGRNNDVEEIVRQMMEPKHNKKN
jgi:hypothetical protein